MLSRTIMVELAHGGIKDFCYVNIQNIIVNSGNYLKN